jgi:hypothetical protein
MMMMMMMMAIYKKMPLNYASYYNNVHILDRPT